MDGNQKAQVTAQMLIRKPVATVFEAFIDPEITKHFWFTKGSAKLQEGSTVTWEWEMYGVSTTVQVKQIIQDKKIVVDWGDPVTTIEFNFTVVDESSTFVFISNYGFAQQGEALLKAINDNTGGFTTVVDGLKAYLEHGIDLNLIGDKFPPGVPMGEHKK